MTNNIKGMGSVHRLDVGTRPKLRVLVVDDDLDTVHSMALLIKAMGHETDFAINGFGAIDSARRFRPHIVIVDFNLPDFKGDKLAQQLKYEPGLENARFIALSGRSDDETKERALAAGCQEFYTKPIAPSILEKLLQDAKPR
jgi:CheY-like chemotaxis protein